MVRRDQWAMSWGEGISPGRNGSESRHYVGDRTDSGGRCAEMLRGGFYAGWFAGEPLVHCLTRRNAIRGALDPTRRSGRPQEAQKLRLPANGVGGFHEDAPLSQGSCRWKRLGPRLLGSTVPIERSGRIEVADAWPA